MTGDPIDRSLVQPAAEHARDPGAHRMLYLAGALIVLGVAGLAVFAFVSIQGLHGDVTAAEGDAHTATNSAQVAVGRAQQLYDQVVKLGAVPVVQPPPPVAVGPAGATGATGATGQPGEAPPCLLTAQQCQGAPGTPGTPGKDGPSGKDGATGPAGQDGAPGKDGAPGQDGAPGHDGPPGVSVTRQYFDRDDQGACRSYNDYSDGRTRVDQGPAGDAACAPAAPPPTTTPSAVLPTGTTLRRRD